jgi:hypothetical protein
MPVWSETILRRCFPTRLRSQKPLSTPESRSGTSKFPQIPATILVGKRAQVQDRLWVQLPAPRNRNKSAPLVVNCRQKLAKSHRLPMETNLGADRSGPPRLTETLRSPENPSARRCLSRRKP